MMLKLSCLCGQTRVETAKRPDFINACNCTLCSKSGAQWGYFHPSDVNVEGRSQGYCREDKAEPGAEIQFCPICGSTTHFTLTAIAVAKYGNGVMGVNVRLSDEKDLTGIEMRFPDGRAWPGEGDVSYVRDPIIIGQPTAGHD